MQRSARWSQGSRWTVAIITSLALLALLAPLGAAQTLPAPLPQIPVAPPSVPALPPIQPAPVAPVAPAPLPAPALPPLPPPVSPALPAPNLLAPLTLEPAPLPLAPAAGGPGSPTAIANEGTDTRATEFERSSAAAVSAASERRLKQTSQRELRRIRGGRWDAALKGTKLRRLRTRLLEHWSCAGVLGSRQRRVLILRAGLFGRAPATWRAVARRVGVSLPRAVRLARSGIVRLSRTGTCIDAGGAALGTSVDPRLPVSEASAHTPEPKGEAERKGERDEGRVLGASAFYADPRLGLLGEDDGGVPDALLAFLAVLLALAGAGALASREGYLPVVFPPRNFEPSGKPLLFLDVDGVVSAQPVPGSAPPGHEHQLGFVPEGAGERIRALSSRYEIIWATGWGQDANTYFGPLLGLEADFPVLAFGHGATSGATSLSSDWKIKAVDRTAGAHAVAWVDDNISRRQERWARRRRMPTRLVRTNPYTGISDDDVRLLLEWADELEAKDDGRSTRTRRTALR